MSWAEKAEKAFDQLMFGRPGRCFVLVGLGFYLGMAEISLLNTYEGVVASYGSIGSTALNLLVVVFNYVNIRTAHARKAEQDHRQQEFECQLHLLQEEYNQVRAARAVQHLFHHTT